MKTTIDEINKEFAIVQLPGGCVRVLHEYTNAILNQKEICFLRISDFNVLMENKHIEVKTSKNDTKTEKASKLWFSSDRRREYKGVVFNPGKNIPDHYNLYAGFSTAPRAGICEKFKKHILEVICSNDQKIYTYLISWLADLFQNPGGKRPGVALVLRGEQGTGKGVFVSQIGQIIGQHYVYVANPEHLTGRFNKHLATALLVFLDEAVITSDKRSQAVLKSLVTEDKLMLESKGQDAVAVDNHSRLILASNDDRIVVAGLEERRFCVLDVSSLHRQDSKYFREICKEMDNGGREAFLHEMLAYDLTGVDLRDFPKTKALLEQKLASLNAFGKFWYNCLREGSICPPKAWGSALTAEIYFNFTSYASNLGYGRTLDESQCSRELLKLCPQAKRHRSSKGTDGKRSWRYDFPSLPECRKMFEEKIGAKIDWEDADDDDGPAG